MRSRRFVVLAMTLGAATACASVIGLDGYDVVPEGNDAAPIALDGGGLDAGTPPSDAAPEATRECGATTCTPPSADGGFTFVLAGNAVCPGGYRDSVVVSDPDAGAGACACGPCTASGSCAAGAIPTGANAGCVTAGVTLTNSPAESCVQTSGNVATTDHARIDAPPPSNKTCSAAGAPVRSGVATTSTHVCAPLAGACASDACMPPSPFKACLIADGDVACPSSYVKKLTGDDVAITCDPCNCTTSGTCSGIVNLYASLDCTGTVLTIASGACVATPSGTPVKSYKWTGNPPTMSCSATPPPQPTSVALAKPKTLCCPP